MILTQDNEYSVVLDACVLVPISLCDTLLRLAEEPAMYRPIWSNLILQEVGHALETKIGITPERRSYRIDKMQEGFPEALVDIPEDLLKTFTFLPDKNDAHVVAAAIRGQAHAIITANTKHFPEEILNKYDISCQHPDEFLIHQYWLNPEQVLEKLDTQAAAINKDRQYLERFQS